MNDSKIKKTLRYDMIGTSEDGIREHPQKVMEKIADKNRWIILDSCPNTISDSWFFWICGYKDGIELPKYLEVEKINCEIL